MSLFDEKDKSRLPLFKMELILDDDDNIQFYPMLEDLEDAILSILKSITGSLQNVQSVQVSQISDHVFYSRVIK